MSPHRDNEYFAGLVLELCKQPRETEWLEFKVNQTDPQAIGEYISALPNSAALNGKANGYLVWGVEDGTHAVVGTSFSPFATKKGNEPLETWLLRLLAPKIHFRFLELNLEDQSVVLLEIGRAFRHPVRFQGEAFLRVGQVKKPLKDAPDRERELWRILDLTPFEDLLAVEHVAADEVLRLLDYPAYFDLLEQPLPANRDGILEALKNDKLIRACGAGGWDVTNLGGILYASGFSGLIGYINNLLPSNEVIGQALRTAMPMFPELAVRELVANALIHQDLFITGVGPMVEIFEDRIEITNPGEPLVDTQRFVDTPPKSRNEVLASLMRRFRICEERGSGIDKVVAQVELYQLPAPLFEVPPDFTRVVLYAHRPLAEMDKADRIRACYLHACLKYVTRDFLTNTSLRARFGIEERNRSTVSRLIREAVEAGAIVPDDSAAAPKLMRYVPWWAAPADEKRRL
jgi:ATP-dependent DNA helicase RecG